jgi:hypothetical protein
MEQRKGFRAFVERHDALFTTAGALIVFVGFFMKEGVQEKTKELSSSIATAHRFYTLHDSLNSIAESEFNIANTLRDVNHATSSNPSEDIFARENSLVSMAPAYSAKLDLERHQFLVTAELLDSLPEKPFSLEDRRQELSDALISDKDVVGLKEAMSSFYASSVSGDKELLEKKKLQVSSLTVHAVKIVLATSSKLKAFTKDVDDEALRQKEEQERKLKSATYVTYGLFALGWCLGLVGKLLKLPALGGGE